MRDTMDMSVKVKRGGDTPVSNMLEFMRVLFADGPKGEMFNPGIATHESLRNGKWQLVIRDGTDYLNAFSLWGECNAAGDEIFSKIGAANGPAMFIHRWREAYKRRVMAYYKRNGIKMTVEKFKLVKCKNVLRTGEYSTQYKVTFLGLREAFEDTHGRDWYGWGRKCVDKKVANRARD